MFWDAELHSWRLVKVSILPWLVIVDAFEREPDPPGSTCRPCAQNAHAECEGEALCACETCWRIRAVRRQLGPLIHDLEEDWDRRDREKSWRD